MQLTQLAIQNIIRSVLHSQDHRMEILALINAEFLDFAIKFFESVAIAKLHNIAIDGDWYKREFITKEDLATDDMIINAGLNKKTLDNSFGSSSRKTVLQVAPEYYDELYSLIQTLTSQQDGVDLLLTIKLRSVSVDLNITESLIVINTLAVKRAQLRGGAWSTTGKSVEKYLMLTLCHLFSVDERYYTLGGLSTQRREIDFFLVGENGQSHFCEVKLMGKGNPESADAVIARDSSVFVADTLSGLNRTQLNQRQIHWLELRSEGGFHKFYTILQALAIPAKPFTGNLDTSLDAIFAKLFA